MPLTPQTPKLARSFDILFDQKKSPATTLDAARTWAKAYTDYAVAGGVSAARAKEPALTAALTTAFNPNLAGGGPPLFIQALTAFWLGLPITDHPVGPGTVSAVIPSGSVNSPQPDNATPVQQADGLAATIAAFTLGSVWMLPTAQPAPPVLIV